MSSGKRAPNGITENMTGTSLTQQVNSLWTTPQAHDQFGAASEESKSKRRDKASKIGLIPQVASWATPNARDFRGVDLPSRNGGASLAHQAQTGEMSHSSHLVPVTSTDGIELSKTAATTSERQRLNPAFVCWLMGWNWWWTRPEPISFAAAEMESYRFKLRSHLLNLLSE